MSAQPLNVLATPAQVDTLFLLRKRFIQVLGLIGLSIGIVGIGLQIAMTAAVWVNMITGAFTVICLLVFWLARQQRITAASALVVGLFVIGALSTPTAVLPLATVGVIAAAVLVSTPVFAAITVLIIVREVTLAVAVWQQTPGEVSVLFTQYIFEIISLLIVSLSTRYFISQMERAAAGAQRSTGLLQAVAEIGQQLVNLLDLSELLMRSVELIRDRLAFYHVQVFLIDDTGDTAQLVASTGEVGQRLLARRHHLQIGSQSVIGQVTLLGRPILARDTDAVYYRNELLPDTRAELAVPVLDGDRIIGALDVQSRNLDAFDADRIQALQVMANLLGTSIRNARLFALQARNAEETQRLYQESEANLREIQRLNQQLTRVGWTDYLRNQETVSGVTLEDGRVISDAQWSDALARAAHSGQPVTTTREDGTSVLALPVELGGEVIGALEVEADRAITQTETVDMLRDVAQRLALSLDKARLFEEAQEATAQEQRINEIVARYQTVSSVDDLLRITLTELSQTLGATRGAIRLSLMPEGEAAS